MRVTRVPHGSAGLLSAIGQIPLAIDKLLMTPRPDVHGDEFSQDSAPIQSGPL